MCAKLFCLIILSVVVFTQCQIKGRAAAITPEYIRKGLSTRSGNFSLELLNKTAHYVGNENLIISPITVWTVLNVIAAGAFERTLGEIAITARIPILDGKIPNLFHQQYNEMVKWLLVNTSTVEMATFNAFFTDTKHQLERDYRELISTSYKTQMIPVNFTDAIVTANTINKYVQSATRGHINELVDEAGLADTEMLLASAVFFKGQWTAPFNKSNTIKRPFTDSKDRKMGEVNMMYNRFTYPFANIRELQARVIEVPYGVENRLSMLVMLPNHNVTLGDMFKNFIDNNLTFDKVFTELRISQEQYGDDEVDLFLPRFKIVSNIRLDPVLSIMGIQDLFDPSYASLPYIARTPLYVSKVIHKAEIEVTEEGTTAAAVTAAEFANRIGTIRFEANRPFAYMIVEKKTNTIVFGGLYQQPSLY